MLGYHKQKKKQNKTKLTISINNRMVKDKRTVTPNDILSPDSGGNRKTSRVKTAINTHGKMKFIM